MYFFVAIAEEMETRRQQSPVGVWTIGGLTSEVLFFLKAATAMMASSIMTKVVSTIRRSGHVSSVFTKMTTRELHLKKELGSNCAIES